MFDDSWKTDNELKKAMKKYVQEGLQRKKILAILTRDFASYPWSMRTMGRRMKHFRIYYSHAVLARVPKDDSTKDLAREVMEESDPDAMQTEIPFDDSWKTDNDLKEAMKKYVQERLQKKKILEILTRDFAGYRWSMRTMARRMEHFDIHYSHSNTSRPTNIGHAIEAVFNELKGPGQELSYQVVYRRRQPDHKLDDAKDSGREVTKDSDVDPLPARIPCHTSKKDDFTKDVAFKIMQDGGPDAVRARVPCPTKMKDDPTKDLAHEAMEEPDPDAMQTDISFDDSWKSDNELKLAMKKYVQEGLQRKKILANLTRDFASYRWSMRTMGRRMKHFGIYYSHSNTSRPKTSRPTSTGHAIEAVFSELEGPDQELSYQVVYRERQPDRKLNGTKDSEHEVLNNFDTDPLQARIPSHTNKKDDFTKDVAYEIMEDGDPDAVQTRVPCPTKMKDDPAKDLAHKVMEQPDPDAMQTEMPFDDSWKTDNELKKTMKKYVQKRLQRKKILAILTRDFASYRWSMRTMARRMKHFNIYYSHSNTRPRMGHAIEAVFSELKGPGQKLSYQVVYRKRRSHHKLNSTKDSGPEVMKDTDSLKARIPCPTNKKDDFTKDGAYEIMEDADSESVQARIPCTTKMKDDSTKNLAHEAMEESDLDAIQTRTDPLQGRISCPTSKKDDFTKDVAYKIMEDADSESVQARIPCTIKLKDDSTKDLAHEVMEESDLDAMQTRILCPTPNKDDASSVGSSAVHSQNEHDQLLPDQCENTTFPIDIYVCMDTCQKKVFWVKVWRSYGNPDIIGRFHLDYLYKGRKMARSLCLDKGTEMVIMAAMHVSISQSQVKIYSMDNVLHGLSMSNQIEKWRMELHERLEKFFKLQLNTLLDRKLYNPNDQLHREILSYVMVPIIQTNIDEFVATTWHADRIRDGLDEFDLPADLKLLEEAADASAMLENSLDYINPSIREACKRFIADPEKIHPAECVEIFTKLSRNVNFEKINENASTTSGSIFYKDMAS